MAGIRGGSDKSLARPTSRCRRTESIVVGKRGLFMCRIAKSFLVTEAARKHVRRRARFQPHRDASCPIPNIAHFKLLLRSDENNFSGKF